MTVPPGPPTVAAAMIHRPKVCDPTVTVAEVRALFDDAHVHAVLVVEHGRLLAVVDRADVRVAPPEQPAHCNGSLAGRVARPDADLARTLREMRTGARRRMAVVDRDDSLVGLLCLKRSGLGFCRDDDVAARAAELGRALPPPALHGRDGNSPQPAGAGPAMAPASTRG